MNPRKLIGLAAALLTATASPAVAGHDIGSISPSPSAYEGQTLTYTKGGHVVDYIWQKCDPTCNNDPSRVVENTATSTYAVGSSDVGTSFRVSTSDGSILTPTPEVSVLADTVSAGAVSLGTTPTAPGQTLTASTTPFTNASGAGTPTLTYAWSRCDSAGVNCVPIAETSSSYTLNGTTDVGSTLKVVVTGTNTFSRSASASATSGVVAWDSAHAGSVSLSGITISGERLVASSAGWTTDNLPSTITHTYEWYRCSNAAGTVCGAVRKSSADGFYDLRDGDEGKYIKVVDTGTTGYGTDDTASTVSAVVALEARGNRQPTVTGRPIVGKTLTVTSAAGWNPSGTDNAVHRYTWYRCTSASDETTCTLIRTQTVSSAPYKDSYTLVDADDGKYIRVVDAVKNASGTWVADDSVTTRVVSSAVSRYRQIILTDGATNYWRLGETGKKAKYGKDEANPCAGLSATPPAPCDWTARYKNVKYTGDGSVGGDSDGSRKFFGKSYIYANNIEVDDAAYSVEAWAKPATCAAGQVLEHGGNGQIYVNDAGRWAFRGQDGTAVAGALTGTSCGSGSWHHLVGTYDSDTGALKLYVDGVLAASSTTSTEPTGAPTFYIGRGHLARGFAGSIDEVALYDRTLSAAQVLDHFDAATPRNS